MDKCFLGPLRGSHVLNPSAFTAINDNTRCFVLKCPVDVCPRACYNQQVERVEMFILLYLHLHSLRYLGNIFQLDVR